MKIAVFSDIHGNYDAFQHAMRIIHSKNVDAIFFLGDIVGYYYCSLDIINSLMSINNLYIVLGNHDELFIRYYDSKNQKLLVDYKKKYGSSFEDLAKKIDIFQYSFLKSIPISLRIELDGIVFLLLHGGPLEPLKQSIYPDNSLKDFIGINADVVFTGHTHYRMNKRIGNLTVINPGSLGQPRDGMPSSIVVYDTEKPEVDFIDVFYNIEDLIYQINSRPSEPPYLIDVLKRQKIRVIK